MAFARPTGQAQLPKSGRLPALAVPPCRTPRGAGGPQGGVRRKPCDFPPKRDRSGGRHSREKGLHAAYGPDGLRTVDTSFEYLSPDGMVFFEQTLEYDPPILRVPRSLALGDTWEESPTRYTYSGSGDSVDDLDMEYGVVAEQIVATGAGSWPALLVEGRDLYTNDLAERDWRVAGVGDVIFATYQNGVPGLAQELVSIELPTETP